MKTKDEILVEMFEKGASFYNQKDVEWAMEEHADQSRKDERIKCLEELANSLQCALEETKLKNATKTLIPQIDSYMDGSNDRTSVIITIINNLISELKETKLTIFEN
ncbi:MAG: hypothetical protein NVS9B7_29280 [Flavisolibacter sp.]